jgi:hypothetical protein
MNKFSHWSDRAITFALISVGIATILVALKIHNQWIKASVLAWEILP